MNEFNHLIDKLASFGVEVADEDKEIILLCSIRDNYDHLVMTITKSSSENLKFDDVVDSLMGEERKKKLFLKHSTNESISMRLVQ